MNPIETDNFYRSGDIIMQPAIRKDELHHLIDAMPEGATWDNLMYEINFMAQVQEGIADVDAGRVISTEALLSRIELWRK